MTNTTNRLDEEELRLLIYGFFEDSPISLVLTEDLFSKYFADHLIKAILSRVQPQSISDKKMEQVFTKYSGHENSDGDWFLDIDEFKSAITDLHTRTK
jgi:hypothetical protein